MSNFKIIAILSASAALLAAETALADEAKADVTVQANENAVQPEVMSDNITVVRDENGNVFYNQIVEIEDLQEVELDAEVVDTFTYEYQGRTYTNKIVR
jgi:hypothetical protein